MAHATDVQMKINVIAMMRFVIGLLLFLAELWILELSAPVLLAGNVVSHRSRTV
jgi:hypothetical protein